MDQIQRVKLYFGKVNKEFKKKSNDDEAKKSDDKPQQNKRVEKLN